jgi:small subunit ribosomal protein S16
MQSAAFSPGFPLEIVLGKGRVLAKFMSQFFRNLNRSRKHTDNMVAIRLRREGTKNAPYYKVVVADQRSPRDGKFIEIIGNYDPRKQGLNANIDLARVDYWVKNGARPSDTVRTLVKQVRRAAAKA